MLGTFSEIFHNLKTSNICVCIFVQNLSTSCCKFLIDGFPTSDRIFETSAMEGVQRNIHWLEFHQRINFLLSNMIYWNALLIIFSCPALKADSQKLKPLLNRRNFLLICNRWVQAIGRVNREWNKWFQAIGRVNREKWCLYFISENVEAYLNLPMQCNLYKILHHGNYSLEILGWKRKVL